MQQLLQKGFPVTIQGKPYRLRFDMEALLVLDKQFGIKRKDLAKLQTQKREEWEEYELLKKLVVAMTASSETPATVKDVAGMYPDEMLMLQRTLGRAVGISLDGGLGKEKAATDNKPVAESASSGTGTSRSRKQSTASVSRRRGSGGSRRSNSK